MKVDPRIVTADKDDKYDKDNLFNDQCLKRTETTFVVERSKRPFIQTATKSNYITDR